MKRVYGDEPTIKMTGYWKMEVHGPDGQLKQKVEGPNVVTTVGKEFLASYLYSAAVAAATFTARYVAIGTDATAEAASNTALGTEVARHTGTVSYISGQIYQVKATFGTGLGTGTIVEYGLFSSSTAGTLIARDTESAINKGANDTLTVYAQFTLS